MQPVSYSTIFGDFVTEGCGRPSLKQLNDQVIQAVAVKWKDLGFQLLNNASAQNILEIIEANHKQVVNFVSNNRYVSYYHDQLAGCCEMLSRNVC